jgi:transposase-like protein
MREEWPMAKRKRRKHTAEFKADAARLCRNGSKSVAQVANDLDIADSLLREWVKRAEIDEGKGLPGELTTVERNELQELRRRVKRLEMERTILKNAAAFFARENG